MDNKELLESINTLLRVMQTLREAGKTTECDKVEKKMLDLVDRIN